MTAGLFVLLVAAGIAAGLCASVAGMASLFSYPALLAAGLTPVTANVTNTVALATGSITAMVSSRPELAGQARTVRRLVPVAIAGGTTGAALLLVTPPTAFARLVPFLVGASSLVLLLPSRSRRSPAVTTAPPKADMPGRKPVGMDPDTRHRIPARSSRTARVLVIVGLFAVSLYAGYFGAAAGVVLLALLFFALPESLIRVNALKNVLLAAANGIAALAFAAFGHVAWAYAIPLTLGMLAGNWTGPAVARRLPTTVLRVGIAIAGLGLAVKLGVDAF